MAKKQSSQEYDDDDISLDHGPPPMLDWLTISLGALLAVLFGFALAQAREIWLELQQGSDSSLLKGESDGRGVALLDLEDDDMSKTVASYVDRNEPFVCRACLPEASLGGWWDNDENLLELLDADSYLPVRVAKRNTLSDKEQTTQFRRTTAPEQGGGSAYEQRNMTVKQFFDSYQDLAGSDEHLYLAQVDLVSTLEGLLPCVNATSPPPQILDAVGPMPPVSDRPLSLYLGAGLRTTQLHYDSLENVVCLVSGTSKHFDLYDPMTSATFLYIDRERDGNGSPAVAADKEFELFKYALPSRVTLQKGDCLYLPVYWYHTVMSSQDRTISINWWRTPANSKMNVLENLFCGRDSPKSIGEARAKC